MVAWVVLSNESSFQESIVYLDRYGKPVVLDMMDVDMFDTATMKFDDVQKGLMASLMSKDLLKDNK